MTFACISTPELKQHISTLSSADDLTLIIGAGVSTEAGLPGWGELLDRLLRRASEELEPQFSSEESLREWVSETIENDSLLGAAAVVESIMKSPPEQWLRSALLTHDDGSPRDSRPGPIASQISFLMKTFGQSVRVLTTNYDDLIERALTLDGTSESQVRSYVSSKIPQSPTVYAVHHLHGFTSTTRNFSKGKLILSEEHYHGMQVGSSWQERFVLDRLKRSRCLFIGSSLSDPNLIRYLYGYKNQSGGSMPHFAVFIRQSEHSSAHAEVRSARERSVAKRWMRCGVTPIFLDHYADAAQFVFEIAHRRSLLDQGKINTYRPPDSRSNKRVSQFLEKGLKVHDENSFRIRQVVLSSALRELISNGLHNLEVGPNQGEQLGLTVWFVDSDGRTMTSWAYSDRAHQDPMTVAPIPISAQSKWVAVACLCKGLSFQEDLNNYASRWRFVRGLPLISYSGGRVIIGCVTVTSSLPSADSVLNQLSDTQLRGFHKYLQTGTLELVEQLSTV